MSKYGIAVDLGASKIKIGIGSKDRILCTLTKETAKKKESTAISKQIKEMIHSVLDKTGVKIADVCGIGIGSIGKFDKKRGSIVNSSNLSYKGRIPVLEPIKKEFKKPVYLENDCRVAVIGEKNYGIGKRRRIDNLAYITISTGIGGGIYIDGHLLHGKDNNAIEPGHFVVDFSEKLRCGCGKKGHWEAYCSGRNMPNYVKLLCKEDPKISKFSDFDDADWNRIDTKKLYDLAKKGNKTANYIVKGKIGKLNAIGFACITNAYDPEIITVGGSVTLNNKKLILAPIQSYIENYLRNRKPKILITPLGEDAVIYGGLALAYGKR